MLTLCVLSARVGAAHIYRVRKAEVSAIGGVCGAVSTRGVLAGTEVRTI